MVLDSLIYNIIYQLQNIKLVYKVMFRDEWLDYEDIYEDDI